MSTDADLSPPPLGAPTLGAPSRRRGGVLDGTLATRRGTTWVVSALIVYLLMAYTVWAVLYPLAASNRTVVFGSHAVSYYDLLLLTAFVLVAMTLLSNPPRESDVRIRLVLWTIIFYLAFQMFVIAPLAITAGGQPPVGVLVALEPRLATALILFFYWYGLRSLGVERVLNLLLVAAVVLALVAAYRVAVNSPELAATGSTERLRALWGPADLVFGWAILWQLFHSRDSTVGWPILAVVSMGFILTNHRSGYLALALAILFHLIVHPVAHRRAFLILTAVFVAATGLYTFGGSIGAQAAYSIETAVSPTTRGAVFRLGRWHDGLQYFTHHPVGDLAFQSRVNLLDKAGVNAAAHNALIEVLDAEGVQGAVFYIALTAQVVAIGWRIRRVDSISAMAISYLVYFVVFSSFNANFLLPHTVLLVVLPPALILYQAKMRAQRTPDAREPADQPSVGPDNLEVP
jgi:hypothetical protein